MLTVNLTFNTKSLPSGVRRGSSIIVSPKTIMSNNSLRFSDQNGGFKSILLDTVSLWYHLNFYQPLLSVINGLKRHNSTNRHSDRVPHLKELLALLICYQNNEEPINPTLMLNIPRYIAVPEKECNLASLFGSLALSPKSVRMI